MICALCKEDRILQESHIIPKFITKWLRETGGGKFLRYSANINKREQDSRKYELLCSNCEQRFSKYEKWFAENMFKPFIENEYNVESFEYSEKLYYFVISLLWRILVVELQVSSCYKYPQYPIWVNCEEEWRNFLFKNKPPLRFYNIHLQFHGGFVVNNSTDLKDINNYFLRQCDCTIVHGNVSAIYFKIPRFTFWGSIEGIDESKMVGSKIDHFGGIITTNQYFSEDNLCSFLYDRLKIMEELENNITQNQIDKIKHNYKYNVPNFKDSDAYRVNQFDNYFDDNH